MRPCSRTRFSAFTHSRRPRNCSKPGSLRRRTAGPGFRSTGSERERNRGCAWRLPRAEQNRPVPLPLSGARGRLAAPLRELAHRQVRLCPGVRKRVAARCVREAENQVRRLSQPAIPAGHRRRDPPAPDRCGCCGRALHDGRLPDAARRDLSSPGRRLRRQDLGRRRSRLSRDLQAAGHTRGARTVEVGQRRSRLAVLRHRRGGRSCAPAGCVDPHRDDGRPARPRISFLRPFLPQPGYVAARRIRQSDRPAAAGQATKFRQQRVRRHRPESVCRPVGVPVTARPRAGKRGGIARPRSGEGGSRAGRESGRERRVGRLCTVEGAAVAPAPRPAGDRSPSRSGRDRARRRNLHREAGSPARHRHPADAFGGVSESRVLPRAGHAPPHLGHTENRRLRGGWPEVHQASARVPGRCPTRAARFRHQAVP